MLGSSRRQLRGIYPAALAVALLAGAGVARPAEVPAAGDWQLALQARNALWDDPAFAALNLGVTVRQGVATIQGPVPSRGAAEQAVERLRKVPGIRDVVNDTFVPAADEPLARSMPHPVTTQRPTVSVAPAVPPDPVTAPPPVAAPAKEPAAALGPPVAAPVK